MDTPKSNEIRRTPPSLLPFVACFASKPDFREIQKNDAAAKECEPDVFETVDAYSDAMDPVVRRYLDVRSVL